uniref:DNA-directed RNA polymerase n=1 Tax=Panagrolaimus sp. ES5 TaxID=591445 RepID=A0AC34FZU5_9BILA
MIKTELNSSSDDDELVNPKKRLSKPLKSNVQTKIEEAEEDSLDKVVPFLDEETDDEDGLNPRFFENQHPVLEQERKHVCQRADPAPQPAVPDKWKLVPAFLKTHIEKFGLEEYRKIWVGRVNYEEGLDDVNNNVTPQECRLRDLTYSAPILVDLEYTRGNQRVLRRGQVIGRMPIMIRSNRCALHQMETLEDMAKTRECAYDPGGYFIIRGTEKVVLMHEQMAKNRIMINRNSKKELVCEVLSSTSQRKSKTYVVNKKGKYYVQHNQLSEDVPIAVLFKALGMESDADVVSLIGSEEYFIGHIGASMIEGSMLKVRKCRLRDLTYSAPILVDLEYTRGNQRVLRRGQVIGRMPIMIRSNRCALHQMETLEDMAKTRECAYDPGGYFIIRGTEKVVLMHEQMAKNRIMINRNSKKELVCEVLSSTSQRKSKTYVVNKKGKYYVQHNQLSEDVPIAVLFKALGMESDADVVSLIGSEEYFIGHIGASMIEGSMLKVRSVEEAVRFIAGKVKLRRVRNVSTEMREHDALDFLTNSFIAHIPCNDGSMLMKAIYLGLMVRRLIEAEVGIFSEDDRDFYGNKRIELAGSMLALLFEDLFKRFNMELKRVADTHLTKNLATPLDIIKHIRQDFITSGLTYALSTGNWIIKRFKMQRMGVTQVLCRLSYISVLGMMSRINSTFERTRKVSGPRSLQPSQWGMLCPCDTPEGESCGLVKSLALMCHITTDSDDEQIRRLMYNCGVESMTYNRVAAIHQSHIYTAFLN